VCKFLLVRSLSNCVCRAPFPTCEITNDHLDVRSAANITDPQLVENSIFFMLRVEVGTASEFRHNVTTDNRMVALPVVRAAAIYAVARKKSVTITK